ncbi:SdpI family protein [Sphingomonas sp. HDW15A]|uniref:SdpI family protein n=1 Tax=Sphingomonas sp. HDW15A TaxID=2714942 RepID=UPI0019D1F038|nr:SdpI family protein [Sphingomonas sp. HDW15A]
MTKELTGSLMWAGGIIAVALGATASREAELIDGDTATRIVLAVTGLMVAWYGNRMPKTFTPSASARRANRVGGWSMALSGLLYAGLWALAPFDVALWVGCGAIFAGIMVTAGYCFSLRSKAKAA